MLLLVTWATSRESLSSEIFYQVRFKPAYSAIEASYNPQILNIASIHNMILSKQRTTKVLIRLHGCAGWSVPLLFAYDIDTFSHDLAQFINQIEILKKHIPVIYQGIRHFSCQKCSMVKFTMMKLTIFLTMPMYPNPNPLQNWKVK